jgi:phenylalanyl-tRNA synthetase beta subunit
MGILHPDVLQAFDMNYPASILEINIETLFEEFKGDSS